MRVLVGVSSVGLGHVKRSLNIIRELESLSRGLEVVWVCAPPALDYLEAVGAPLAPESHTLRSLSEAFEKHSSGGTVDGLRAVREAYSIAKQNYQVIARMVGEFDVLVQDEFLETLLAERWEPNPRLPAKRVAITDFVDVGVVGGGFNPVRRLISMYAERVLRRALLSSQVRIFADSLSGVPPRLRGWVQRNFVVTGPITQADTANAATLRKSLLEGSSRSMILSFTIGGTSIGKHILDFAWKNRVELSETLDALLLFLTGPRVDPKQYAGDERRVVAVGFTPNSTDYFQASDCVVTQAGASTLNELEALGKPTVCVPIEGHWEQERNARRFNTRENYAVVRPSELTADTLLGAVRSVASKPGIAGGGLGGARVAAQAIKTLLEGKV